MRTVQFLHRFNTFVALLNLFLHYQSNYNFLGSIEILHSPTGFTSNLHYWRNNSLGLNNHQSPNMSHLVFSCRIISRLTSPWLNCRSVTLIGFSPCWTLQHDWQLMRASSTMWHHCSWTCISAKMGAISSASPLRRWHGIKSGPDALMTFRLLASFSTPSVGVRLCRYS